MHKLKNEARPKFTGSYKKSVYLFEISRYLKYFETRTTEHLLCGIEGTGLINYTCRPLSQSCAGQTKSFAGGQDL